MPTPMEYSKPKQMGDTEFYTQVIWDADNKKGYIGILKMNKDGTLERCSFDFVKDCKEKQTHKTK